MGSGGSLLPARRRAGSPHAPADRAPRLTPWRAGGARRRGAGWGGEGGREGGARRCRRGTGAGAAAAPRPSLAPRPARSGAGLLRSPPSLRLWPLPRVRPRDFVPGGGAGSLAWELSWRRVDPPQRGPGFSGRKSPRFGLSLRLTAKVLPAPAVRRGRSCPGPARTSRSPPRREALASGASRCWLELTCAGPSLYLSSPFP